MFGMDVTDDESMVSGVQRIIDERGRIDVLVNNAGYGSYGAVEDVPLDEARRQFEVNVFGLARMCQLVIPHMRAQKSGRIINISSIGGKFYEPLGAWYHATKFAVEGFSDSLRLELAPFGIDVVIIEPAAIRTEWNEISRDSLTATSAGGAYEEMAVQVARVMERADKSRLLVDRSGAGRQEDRHGGAREHPAGPVPGRPRRPDHRPRAAAAAGRGVRLPRQGRMYLR